MKWKGINSPLFLYPDEDFLPDIDIPDAAPPSTDEQPALNDDQLDIAWAEFDERQRSLELNPELEDLEDNGYEWTTSDWEGLPPVVPLGARGRVLPEEDVEKVTGPHCRICTDRITHAAVLKCMHMLCINCFENRDVEKCPFCQAPKIFQALCNLGTIAIDRIVEEPDVPIAIPAVPLAEQRERLGGSQEERNDEAINEALRQGGVADPVAYRAQLRRAYRSRRERGPRRHYTDPTANEDEEDGRQEINEQDTVDNQAIAEPAPAADADGDEQADFLGADEDFFADHNDPTDNRGLELHDGREPTNSLEDLIDDTEELGDQDAERQDEVGDGLTHDNNVDAGNLSDDSILSYPSSSQMTLRSRTRNRLLIDDSDDEDGDAPTVPAPKRRRRQCAKKKSRGGRRD